MEWQPIETAPRDGTRILIARKDWVQTGVWSAEFFASAKSPQGAWLDDNDDCGPNGHDWPTHWMPLPPPPA